MPTKLAVLMDPIEKVKVHKDSTLAMLLEAQRRNYLLHYVMSRGLALRQGVPWARLAPLRVFDDPTRWYERDDAVWQELTSMDMLLIRTDPPFEAEYLYDTIVLEQAERNGLRVVNPPQALRDCNEKLYALQFPQCCVPTQVSRSRKDLRNFAKEHGEIVLKPLDGMGGRRIFRSSANDPNLNVILESLVGEDQHLALAQRFIPEIRQGDKRILVIDGVPIPYALARVPSGSDFRGNLAAGGHGIGIPLCARDRWIVEQV
ncbi:MAG TPA: glutathione synthase, partial [Mizugakiibacter sp.]|nr:glutathione synthase [Mizugakiibacter sp.]